MLDPIVGKRVVTNVDDQATTYYYVFHSHNFIRDCGGPHIVLYCHFSTNLVVSIDMCLPLLHFEEQV